MAKVEESEDGDQLQAAARNTILQAYDDLYTDIGVNGNVVGSWADEAEN